MPTKPSETSVEAVVGKRFMKLAQQLQKATAAADVQGNTFKTAVTKMLYAEYISQVGVRAAELIAKGASVSMLETELDSRQKQLSEEIAAVAKALSKG